MKILTSDVLEWCLLREWIKESLSYLKLFGVEEIYMPTEVGRSLHLNLNHEEQQFWEDSKYISVGTLIHGDKVVGQLFRFQVDWGGGDRKDRRDADLYCGKGSFKMAEMKLLD